MRRFLALPATRRAAAFDEAAAKTGWPAASVEKDFWVCLVLREVCSLPDYGEHVTFKGGTSLAKAWQLIERFSEDVDLTLDREALGFGGPDAPEAATSGNERRRRLQNLTEACRRAVRGEIAASLVQRLAAALPVAPSWRLTADDDDPDGQTLLFEYPRARAAGVAGYLRPVVKLEFGARSDPWPVEPRQIGPLVAEAFPSLFDAPHCTVRTLRPERTFWEKVMLLHEETFRPADKPRRARMARHYYDVWRLIEAGVARSAAADDELFARTAQHRQDYFRQNWVDYGTLVRGRVQMLPQPEQEAQWRADYQAMRSAMFVHEPPPFEAILDAVRRFQDEFNSA